MAHVYARNTTVRFGQTVIGVWTLWIVLLVFSILYGIEPEIREGCYFVLTLGLVVVGIVGLLLGWRGLIPLEMGLWTLIAVGYLYLCWGSGGGFKEMNFTLAFLLSYACNLWYLMPSTRESSGRFES